MNFKEKTLYHQVHPAKLLTDWITAIPSLYLLWNQVLLLGLAITFVPSIVSSAIIIQFVNLDRYQQSSVGKYLAKYMTSKMQALRFAGLIIMLVGAWYQVIWLIPTGLTLILLAWLRGRILPAQN